MLPRMLYEMILISFFCKSGCEDVSPFVSNHILLLLITVAGTSRAICKVSFGRGREKPWQNFSAYDIMKVNSNKLNRHPLILH